jgi:hypothetical protein
MTNSTQTLPAVEFSRSGPITAAEAAYSDDSANVWVRHPQGGSVLVCNAGTQSVAAAAVDNLNDVIGAWARFSIDPDA